MDFGETGQKQQAQTRRKCQTFVLAVLNAGV
jgi:hypothetical protein